jgi:hypothetical protein
LDKARETRRKRQDVLSKFIGPDAPLSMVPNSEYLENPRFLDHPIDENILPEHQSAV